jgi:hypothetical protein
VQEFWVSLGLAQVFLVQLLDELLRGKHHGQVAALPRSLLCMSECDAAELCTSNLHATCAVWTSRIGVKPALILPPAKHSVRTICGRTWLIGGGGWPQVRGPRASQRGARPPFCNCSAPSFVQPPFAPGHQTQNTLLPARRRRRSRRPRG